MNEQKEILDNPVPPLKIGPHEIWPPVLPAPMCGISDRPWRMLAREQGCPLVYTQMISSDAVVRGAGRDKTWNILDMFLEEPLVCAQVFGSNPDYLAETARQIQKAGAAIVDLNMGCPVNKVVKSNGGSVLMTQPVLVREIFRKMRAAVTIPFTVKFRAGWEKFGGEAITIAKLAQEEGLDAVCIHARTREQKYSGNADWSIIPELKSHISLPVIGNGDIRSADDAVRMIRDYQADGVMVGRGCMGNPWLLGQIVARLKGEPEPPEPTIDERFDTMLRHVGLMIMRKGETQGIREFRKHVVQYMKGFSHAKEIKQKLLQTLTMDEFVEVLNWGRDTIKNDELQDTN
jgi:tRNA-dihydrouridine synthase B